ncbi:MAG TPA: MarR family transcriptional regulator [Candidatus Acidoferrales bacterium]|nr:MarR family transcriptional regulator [Candidatus Acidoferrales bacterium]
MKRRKAKELLEQACGYPTTLIACPDFVLSTLAMSVTELLEEAIAPLGLRLRHYRLVRLLYFEGPQPQSSLRDALGVDRTTVVSLVDYLEQRGLAKRERSPHDRRAYIITLTPKGGRLAKKATALMATAEQRMFAPLDGDERRLLRQLSTRLLGNPGPIAERHRSGQVASRRLP